MGLRSTRPGDGTVRLLSRRHFARTRSCPIRVGLGARICAGFACWPRQVGDGRQVAVGVVGRVALGQLVSSSHERLVEPHSSRRVLKRDAMMTARELIKHGRSRAGRRRVKSTGMSDRPIGMSPYENARWEDIQAWRSTTPRGLAERLPENVRDRTKQVAQKAGEIWDKVPGNDALESAFASAIKGGFDMALDFTESTISERKVVKRVTKGLSVEATGYNDLRGLDLATLDARAPKIARNRAVLAAGHGAGAGLLAGGATAAGAATGGMGALPAAGIVALTIVADTAAVSVGSIQGAAYVGAHYGYDPTRPAERAMMMGLLAGTLAADAAKVQALRQVRQLALDLAAKRTLQDLSEGTLYRMMLRMYGALMIDATKRSVAKGLPVLGAGVGAATNYHTVRRTIVSAEHAYPERWLIDKYDSATVEIVDVEVVEAAVDAAVGEEDRGILDRLEHFDDIDESGV